MIRIISGLFLLVLLLNAFPSNAFATDFLDVLNSNNYKTEIDFFSEHEIVSGNLVDGNWYFSPERPVTRCEFLKIAYKTLDKKADYENSIGNFSDISSKNWCFVYANMAYDDGVVSGVDGKFFGNNTVSKVEALKIITSLFNIEIGNVTQSVFSDVNTSDWFSSYSHFADKFNIVDVSSYFLPHEPLLRKDVLRIVYRFVYVVLHKTPYSLEILLDESALSQIRHEYIYKKLSGEISINAFENILLDTPINKTYFENDIVHISGRIYNDSDIVTLFFTNTSNDEQKVLSAKVSQGLFSLIVPFSSRGEHMLGILASDKGVSSMYPITVLSRDSKEIKTLGGNDNISCDLQFLKDSVGGVKVKLSRSFFDYIFLIQSGAYKRTFYLHDAFEFDFPYYELQGWEEGDYSINVIGKSKKDDDTSCSSNKNISAVTHHYSYQDESINIPSLSHFHYVDHAIVFSGMSQNILRKEYAVIAPSGRVQMFDLVQGVDGNYIDPKTYFEIIYQPKKPGTYIFEINHKNGIAELNFPIYVGDIYPILPDYRDIMNVYRSFEKNNINVEMSRNILMNLVNVDRENHGQELVALDEALSDLAQAHADDMVKRSFFAHENPDGDSVSQRTKQFEIFTKVGENISQSVSLSYAEKGLMRSAIHRGNILNSEWTKVGFGISQDEKGMWYIVQEFSYDIWEQENEFELEYLTYDLINDFRRNQNLQKLEFSKRSKDSLVKWASSMGEAKDIISEIDGQSVFDILDEESEAKVQGGVLLKVQNYSKLEEKLEESIPLFLKENSTDVTVICLVEKGSAYFVILVFDDE